MELTAAQIRYLLVIYRLSSSGAVRSADIADSLGVTQPSVHRMVAQLCKMDLIEREKYSSVRITECGRALAKQYHICFSRICGLLSKSLNIQSDYAEKGALAILGGLNPAKLEAINAVNTDALCKTIGTLSNNINGVIK